MLHARARAEELAVARIAVFGTWLVIVVTTEVSRYTALPSDVFVPQGLGELVPVVAIAESGGLLVALQVLTVVGCVACILGARPWAPIAGSTWILLFVQDAMMKSIGGFTNHAQMAVLYAALILVLFPCADAFALTRRRTAPRAAREVYGAGMTAVGLVITFAYAFIGIRRMVYGGVEVFTSDAMLAWTVTRTLQHSAYGFEIGLRVLDAPELWIIVLNVGLLVVTICEALSPFALRHRSFRRVWLGVMIPFHVTTLLTMNIFFWENLLLILVFVSPLPTWIAGRRRGRRDRVARGEGIAPVGDPPIGNAVVVSDRVVN